MGRESLRFGMWDPNQHVEAKIELNLNNNLLESVEISWTRFKDSKIHGAHIYCDTEAEPPFNCIDLALDIASNLMREYGFTEVRKRNGY